MEEEILSLWEKLDAFKTSLELSKGNPEFTVRLCRLPRSLTTLEIPVALTICSLLPLEF